MGMSSIDCSLKREIDPALSHGGKNSSEALLLALTAALSLLPGDWGAPHSQPYSSPGLHNGPVGTHQNGGYYTMSFTGTSVFFSLAQ